MKKSVHGIELIRISLTGGFAAIPCKSGFLLRLFLIFLDNLIIRDDVAEGRISGDNDRIGRDFVDVSPPAVGFRRRVGTGRVEFQQGLQGAISDLDNVGIVGQDGLFVVSYFISEDSPFSSCRSIHRV